jgi:hypothetical protein
MAKLIHSQLRDCSCHGRFALLFFEVANSHSQFRNCSQPRAILLFLEVANIHSQLKNCSQPRAVSLCLLEMAKLIHSQFRDCSCHGQFALLFLEVGNIHSQLRNCSHHGLFRFVFLKWQSQFIVNLEIVATMGDYLPMVWEGHVLKRGRKRKT